MRVQIPRYGGTVLGLPARAMVMTNSERTTAACPHRWLLAEGDGLRPMARQAPLEFGIAAHACVEDVHRWWLHVDRRYPGDGSRCVWCLGDVRECDRCDSTGRGPVGLGAAAWLDYALADSTGEYTVDAATDDARRLRRCFGGWLYVHGADPDPDLRVVAPELKLAVPIRGPTGALYAPRSWVVDDGNGGLRVARTGEAHVDGARTVRWPWYQCLTLDALLQHRRSGALYVYEAKTASSPDRRLQSVTVDPQVAGYVWAAQQVVAAGLVSGVDPAAQVVGYVYDVLSNKAQQEPDLLKPVRVQQHDAQGRPLYIEKGQLLAEDDLEQKGRRRAYVVDDDGEDVLRSPGLSVAGAPPSWLYRAAIDRHGFDAADYQDHLLKLMATVDPKLYVRDTATSGPEVGARYARELYTVAQQLATYRRKAAELLDPLDRDSQFPRQPVPCIQGYGCAYRAPCLQDGDLVRRHFTVADPVRWLPDDDDSDNDNDNGGGGAAPQEDLGW